jgi:hypothetical protein
LTSFTVTRLTEHLLGAGGVREATELEAAAAHGIERPAMHHSSSSTTSMTVGALWVEEEERMAVDDPLTAPPTVPRPEADLELPNFPTNMLFFGS